MSDIQGLVFGVGTREPVTSQRPISRLPIANFLGGLNLARADAQLFDNESGDMCNVDAGLSGGFCRRHPVRLHTREDLDAQIVSLGQWQDVDGNAILYMILEDGTVWYTEGGAPADATPTQASWDAPSSEMIQIGFTQYFYGTDQDAVAVEGGPTGTVGTLPWQTIDALPALSPECDGTLIAVGCDDSGNPNFDDERELVRGFPRAECITVHSDFAWAANVVDPDTGERHCSRIYRSFPLIDSNIDGSVWGSSEYIDVDPFNGDCITALVSCGPNLYVFKTNSVYVIQGWDDATGGSITPVQICADAGTISCSTAVCCDCFVYFWDRNAGLMRINGTQVETVFSKLFPLIQKGCIRPDGMPALGCCNGRIHVSVPEFAVTPEDEEQVAQLPASANTTTYVLTPETETWVKYTYGIDRYLPWKPRSEKPRCLAASSVGGNFSVVEIERPGYENYGLDVFSVAGGGTPIESFWRSKWFDGGSPFSRKDWGRVYILAQASPPERTSFEPTRDFDLEVTYLGDWNIGQSIGFGTIGFFDDLADDSVSVDDLEIVELGGEATLVCPPEAVVSDATCPITNSRKEKQCGPEPTAKACSFQIVIKGPVNKPWCVCALLLSLSEEPLRL